MSSGSRLLNEFILRVLLEDAQVEEDVLIDPQNAEKEVGYSPRLPINQEVEQTEEECCGSGGGNSTGSVPAFGAPGAKDTRSVTKSKSRR